MEILSHEEAEKLIKEISQYGDVILSKHAREQMKERGYETPDIIILLKNGTITEVQKDASGFHKYRIEGTDIEGHPGGIITAIIDRSKIVIVTVLGGVAKE